MLKQLDRSFGTIWPGRVWAEFNGLDAVIIIVALELWLVKVRVSADSLRLVSLLHFLSEA